MNELTGLIKCGLCGKNFNFKLNSSTPLYICQTRKNYGKETCNSQVVKEDDILDIIKTHVIHQNKDYTIGKTRLFVTAIRIDDKGIKILYKDGTYSEVSDNFIRF